MSGFRGFWRGAQYFCYLKLTGSLLPKFMLVFIYTLLMCFFGLFCFLFLPWSLLVAIQYVQYPVQLLNGFFGIVFLFSLG